MDQGTIAAIAVIAAIATIAAIAVIAAIAAIAAAVIDLSVKNKSFMSRNTYKQGP